MKKTKRWVIVLSAVLLFSGAISVLMLNVRSEETIVEIVQDGVVIRRIDLSGISEEYSFEIEGAHGRNTVTVQPGRVCVSDSDCPDQVCVHQGWLSGGNLPILCMPHRLIIRVVRGGDDVDAIAG